MRRVSACSRRISSPQLADFVSQLVLDAVAELRQLVLDACRPAAAIPEQADHGDHGHDEHRVRAGEPVLRPLPSFLALRVRAARTCGRLSDPANEDLGAAALAAVDLRPAQPGRPLARRRRGPTEARGELAEPTVAGTGRVPELRTTRHGWRHVGGGILADELRRDGAWSLQLPEQFVERDERLSLVECSHCQAAVESHHGEHVAADDEPRGHGLRLATDALSGRP